MNDKKQSRTWKVAKYSMWMLPVTMVVAIVGGLIGISVTWISYLVYGFIGVLLSYVSGEKVRDSVREFKQKGPQ
jgi:hypothetical protein